MVPILSVHCYQSLATKYWCGEGQEEGWWSTLTRGVQGAKNSLWSSSLQTLPPQMPPAPQYSPLSPPPWIVPASPLFLQIVPAACFTPYGLCLPPHHLVYHACPLQFCGSNLHPHAHKRSCLPSYSPHRLCLSPHSPTNPQSPRKPACPLPHVPNPLTASSILTCLRSGDHLRPDLMSLNVCT